MSYLFVLLPNWPIGFFLHRDPQHRLIADFQIIYILLTFSLMEELNLYIKTCILKKYWIAIFSKHMWLPFDASCDKKCQ